MPKLVISLATRGRPQQLIETLTKSICNLTHPETLFIVHVDEDDRATQWAFLNSVHPAGTLRAAAGQLAINIRPREDTIGAKWNRALEVPADLYLVAADDDPYITPGYDTKLLEAASRFPDQIGMVYGHMANASFPGVVAPTRGLCEKLGGIFPEHFPYWWVDHWTDDIARMIGRISFADVRTDQSKAGRTQEMREPAWWATWFDAAHLMRRGIAEAIIKSDDFQEPQWRKEMLIAQAPLIEARSRWINDQVRAQGRQLEGWSGLTAADERYQRVKQKAVEMIPQLLQGMPEDREPGVLGSWGAAAYRYALTPPGEAPALQRIYG